MSSHTPYNYTPKLSMAQTKVDLESDLLSSEYIRNKCRNSDAYAQNLYAGLCNNLFYKNGEEWSCSWRYAGGIAAELINDNKDLNTIRDNMDYMQFYCSGIACDHVQEYVPESVVTDEIKQDLLKLGWTIKSYETKEGGVSPEAS